MIHLHDLGGLWRRTLIAWPDGRSDSETEVFWLQGPSLYADLRVPAGRPAGLHGTCLRDLGWAMLRFMARQEGFFGRFDLVDSVGTWHRAFDYQPDTGLADRGALTFEDGILVERGIDVPYVEHWSRPSASGDSMAVMLASATRTPGCLAAAGDAFIYARGRASALPRGVTFDRLIDDAASLEAAQALFDCEISFGRRNGGDWRIERSSHCFREGATLSPVFDSATGSLTIDDVAPDGMPVERTWRVISQEGTSPLSIWFTRNDSDVRPQPCADKRTIEMAGAAR